jgi:hypothetical protein
LEREFLERLSPESRRYRFLGPLKTPSPELLRQVAIHRARVMAKMGAASLAQLVRMVLDLEGSGGPRG